jgi:hypothetical protein
MFNPEFLTTDSNDGQAGNSLIQYLQEQTPDTLQRVAKSASNDIQAGFDSRTHEKVSKSSAELQLVNLIFHIFKWRK